MQRNISLYPWFRFFQSLTFWQAVWFLFFQNRLTPGEAMALPYHRMVIMHVTLLFGGLLLAKTGQPLAGLILLVLVKIVMDVHLHRREHARLQDIV